MLKKRQMFRASQNTRSNDSKSNFKNDFQRKDIQ
uniref:Uncharacterized protein n=1 Tax=Rhizophora mucronata TaxID=61149 RepID=A0A2P2NVH3_RHIMU